MEIVVKVAAALAAYLLATEFIAQGQSFLLVGIMYFVGLHFVVSGLMDLWTEIERARSDESDEG